MINVFGSKTNHKEISNVTESLQSQWLGMGPKVSEFEKRYQERLGLKNFLMVDSGSNALFMAVTLLNLPKESEVILPSFTWVSCAQAVLMAGHKPIFCDVDPFTMNVTAEHVKAQITDKTGAVMVVHYAGLPVDMDEIMALGYPVIEDAAHAVDSHYKGVYCGGISDVGIYSFDAVKNIAVGEGGGITMQNERSAHRAKLLRYSGIGKSGFEASTQGKSRWWEYNISEPFIKMNPSDIAGGIALGQLDNLDENQARRKYIWDAYQDAFKGLKNFANPLDAPKECKHSYFTYSIRLMNGQRDALAKYLFDNGIYTTLRYHPLHLNPLYKQMNKKLKFSEMLNEDCLSIPLHPNLSDEDVEKVVHYVKMFVKG
ncbi:MAG: DegT/DnrJ/EryC1/StrS family aminotransferase [Pseudomonadota bacterium]|nr:DegT/DnrJ/EryC1/StrS family aminotransferase [Pseudomonadota bacterium]